MASLYKNRGNWYLAICHQGKRINRSLGTKDKKVAKQLQPHIESLIILELTGIRKRNLNLTFSELVPRFLKASITGLPLPLILTNTSLPPILKAILFPPTLLLVLPTLGILINVGNGGLKNNLIKKAHLIPGDTKGESRIRTYTKNELEQIFTLLEDDTFNSFVQFAYYTGARSGEIRSISRNNVLEDLLLVHGKSGRRIVKLNSRKKT